jgi:cytochrome c biogenesis protein CcdA
MDTSKATAVENAGLTLMFGVVDAACAGPMLGKMRITATSMVSICSKYFL